MKSTHQIGNFSKVLSNILKNLTDDIEMYHIVSEPGDATHYDYMMIMYYDEYFFVPFKSTFGYPRKLNYHKVNNLDDETLVKLAIEENCNPYTLKECIRSMKEHYEER